MSRAGTKGNLESPSDQPVDQHPESTRVTAVLVTHNSAGVIIDALASLAAILAIVVDNGSGDGTCDLVTKRFPATTILSSTTNVGFGRANNLALGRVKTEFAFLLNPDARLVPETLPELLRAADRYPDAAILAPVLADASGRREPSVRVPFLDRRRHGSKLDIHEPRGDTCVEMVSGAAMLVRMSALGPRRELFDPNIFLYFEDDDACMQLRRSGNGGSSRRDVLRFRLCGGMQQDSPPDRLAPVRRRQVSWQRARKHASASITPQEHVDGAALSAVPSTPKGRRGCVQSPRCCHVLCRASEARAANRHPAILEDRMRPGGRARPQPSAGSRGSSPNSSRCSVVLRSIS
jgi:GT2 family glycosyltransferase